MVNSLIILHPRRKQSPTTTESAPKRPPPYPVRQKEDFFPPQAKLNNNVTSFYASYDSANRRYRFSGMREYLLEMLKKTDITPEDYTFTLTPVNIETETNTSTPLRFSTTYVSAINPISVRHHGEARHTQIKNHLTFLQTTSTDLPPSPLCQTTYDKTKSTLSPCIINNNS